MRFDTIVIGGGLSGLMAGINLMQRGQHCLIISSGQSALHFFSGSMELYGVEGNPMEAIAQLPASHPYAKIGIDNVQAIVDTVKPFFQEIGFILNGDSRMNHYRITPMGFLKPVWLTMEEYAHVTDKENFPWHQAALINIEGFLDFHASFLAAGLEKWGVESRIANVTLPQLEHIRRNPTEMRSTNIAKVLTGDVIQRLAAEINLATNDAEVVIMPAVVGLYGKEEVNSLKDKVYKPLRFIPTMPPSVPGIRMQIALRHFFQKIGGVYLLGDSVESGIIRKNRLLGISTSNHGEMRFEADNYIMATGSFFSHGLKASADAIYEPVLGLDTAFSGPRSKWYHEKLFAEQPYMKFGIATDDEFHALKDGIALQNVYVAGAGLSGFDAIKEGCGAGVSITTAIHVANTIINKSSNGTEQK
ncbi:MAG: anaerobic glycerol-3-phosphate dehydrogenase subunit GlpB [Bacteroidales bacterium]|nr:anaerobic glycerol-3-phosphate dehydrogenase subunit GlpB [Bacteroidales bacterium]